MTDLQKENRIPTQEQLCNDAGYHRSEQLLISMLNCELISVDEFNKITELNRKSFSPYLVDIMPNIA